MLIGKLQIFGRIDLQLLDDVVIIAEESADGTGLAGTGADAVAGGSQVVKKGVDVGQRNRLDDREIQARNIGFVQRLVFGDDTAALCDKTEEIAQVEIIVFHGEFGTVFDGQQVKKEVLQKLWASE